MANGENPFVSRYGGAPTGGPFKSAKKLDFELAHAKADTDTERGALHHTLGSGPNQALPGNTPLVKPSAVTTWNPNFRLTDNNAILYTLIYAISKVVDGVCTWHVRVSINSSNVLNLMFDLPTPIANIISIVYVGTGRESAINGEPLLCVSTDGIVANVFLGNNSTAVVNGYILIMGGSYLVDMDT